MQGTREVVEAGFVFRGGADGRRAEGVHATGDIEDVHVLADAFIGDTELVEATSRKRLAGGLRGCRRG